MRQFPSSYFVSPEINDPAPPHNTLIAASAEVGLVSSLFSSIGSMGLWGYWAIGLMTFVEALVLTSVLSPGTVVIVPGGALAAQGIFDIGDMMWFVGIGTILGSQASLWLGGKGEKLLG